MTAQIIDGHRVQQMLFDRARSTIRAGVTPTIALIMVEGDNPLVGINFRLHLKIFDEVGIAVRPVALPVSTDRDTLLGVVSQFNDDEDVHAIMTLVPLPPHLDIREVLATVRPDKEVEGIHPAHTARLNPLSTEPPRLLPLVPVAALTMLASVGFLPTLAHVVTLVDPEQMEANPIAKMVARGGAFAALPPDAIGSVVPVTHPRAAEVCRQADLLVVTLEKPRVVTADWVKPGAIVLDYNWMLDGTRPHPTDPVRRLPHIVGGVDVESVEAVAAAISPIPGGIGPVMLGVLVERIVQAAQDRAACVAELAAA